MTEKKEAPLKIKSEEIMDPKTRYLAQRLEAIIALLAYQTKLAFPNASDEQLAKILKSIIE